MAAIAPELSVLARDEAFEALYRRYVKDVYHYALALLRNPADAEDVTQTTFMNAYRAYCRGDHIERPQNWLIKITHNVARTRYARSSRRVKEVPLEDHVDRLAVPEDERPNVEGVLRALGRLPFNQRAALIMRELEGRSYGEIAETLNVSVAAVETLIFRARRSLRLRASALRSLGAVPLPASLAQLVEGGGVVAGGGALLGSGFIFKAALALVAGALATGLGGGQQTKRVVAARPHVASNAVRGALPQTRVGRAAVVDARRVPTARAADAQVLSPSARHADPVATGGSRQVTAPLAGSSSAAAPAGPASPASATEPVDQVVATVETTISVPSSSLPVQVPSVPDLPVQPPALPKLP